MRAWVGTCEGVRAASVVVLPFVPASVGVARGRFRAARPSLSAIGGRGLSIVEQLCSSWGVRAEERGSTVWAVLLAPRASPGSGRSPGAVSVR